MSDTPPDRLSLNPRSPHFDSETLQRGVGIRFNGVEKTNVEEYCISEGWIRVAAGRSLDRFGNPMTVRLKGTVEPYFEDIAGGQDGAGSDEPGLGESAQGEAAQGESGQGDAGPAASEGNGAEAQDQS